MAYRIAEYRIYLIDAFTHDMPRYASVVSIGMKDDDVPVMWIMEDIEQSVKTRFFFLTDNFEEIPDELWEDSEYFGSFTQEHGHRVYHLWENLKGE